MRVTSTPFESSSDSSATGHPRRWWILLILCLSLMVLVVDNTVLNLAIPSLMRDLDATPADIQWVIDAYILAFAGLLLTAGSLSDRFGRRKMLLLGLVIFGVASLLATLAQNPGQLIACRGLMGVGGALLMPSTLSLLFTVFPPQEQRKAMAGWSMVAMVGVVAGPTVGGVLLNHFWWGSIFWLNVPIAVLAIIGTLALIPESKGPARDVDPAGAVLSIIGMAAVVWAIISIPADGFGSAKVLGGLAVGVAALTGFALWEMRSEHPMVPLALFRDRNFSGTSFSIVLLSFTAGGLLLALTQYLQFVLGYTPLKAGLALIPYAVAATVFNALGATLGKKMADRTLIVRRAGDHRRQLRHPDPGLRLDRLRPADHRPDGDGRRRRSGRARGVHAAHAGGSAGPPRCRIGDERHRPANRCRAVGRRTGQRAGRGVLLVAAGLGPRTGAHVDRGHARPRPGLRAPRPGPPSPTPCRSR